VAAPRQVTIHRIAIAEVALPRVVLELECTKGTYVRSIAFELGRALGCGAHLGALRRTRTGSYAEADAIPLDQIDRDRGRAAIIPLARSTGMPSVEVEPALEPLIALGVNLSAEALGQSPQADIFQLVSHDGRLLALVGLKAGAVRYHRVFNS
jgi:tRNA pseudouridine55 synthase